MEPQSGTSLRLGRRQRIGIGATRFAYGCTCKPTSGGRRFSAAVWECARVRQLVMISTAVSLLVTWRNGPVPDWWASDDSGRNARSHHRGWCPEMDPSQVPNCTDCACLLVSRDLLLERIQHLPNSRPYLCLRPERSTQLQCLKSHPFPS